MIGDTISSSHLHKHRRAQGHTTYSISSQVCMKRPSGPLLISSMVFSGTTWMHCAMASTWRDPASAGTPDTAWLAIALRMQPARGQHRRASNNAIDRSPTRLNPIAMNPRDRNLLEMPIASCGFSRRLARCGLAPGKRCSARRRTARDLPRDRRVTGLKFLFVEFLRAPNGPALI